MRQVPDDREELGNAGQKPCDHVARADAAAPEVIGEARAVNAHLRERDCLALAGCSVPFERDGPVLGPMVAAFDTGVDAGRQRSLQDLLLEFGGREVSDGFEIVAHRLLPALCRPA